MRWLRLRALFTANLVLFFLFLVGLVFTGHAQENAELTDHEQLPQSVAQYVGSSSFGEAVFENWESEFLAVAAIIGGSIYLRQRRSAQSKPVHAPHSARGG